MTAGKVSDQKMKIVKVFAENLGLLKDHLPADVYTLAKECNVD